MFITSPTKYQLVYTIMGLVPFTQHDSGHGNEFFTYLFLFACWQRNQKKLSEQAQPAGIEHGRSSCSRHRIWEKFFQQTQNILTGIGHGRYAPSIHRTWKKFFKEKYNMPWKQFSQETQNILAQVIKEILPVGTNMLTGIEHGSSSSRRHRT